MILFLSFSRLSFPFFNDFSLRYPALLMSSPLTHLTIVSLSTGVSIPFMCREFLNWKFHYCVFAVAKGRRHLTSF